MDQTVIYCVLFVSLALLVGLLMSKLMRKIHFPNVTGFLLAGILIGPWVLGWINQTEFTKVISSLNWITEIALGFIAFTIGGSFKTSALKKVGKRATIISVCEALGGAIVVCIALIIGYFCGLKDLGLSLPVILILSSIACATAPAATLLVISQYKAKGPVTETLIPVVAFDDAVALIVFAVLFSISKMIAVGTEFSVLEAIVFPILEIVFSLLIGGLVGFLISMATRWFKSRHNRLILIICAVLLCVGLCQIDFKTVFNLQASFQLSSLLTAMAVGAIYHNLAKGIETTAEYLDKFTSPIFMLFFILSGAKLNFGVFAQSGAYIIVIIAAIYLLFRVVGKWSGSALGSVITKCEPNIKKYLGFTLIPQAGVALGLASSAQTFLASAGKPEMGELIYTVIIVSTIIYELVGPLVTKWALSKAGEISPENLK